MKEINISPDISHIDQLSIIVRYIEQYNIIFFIIGFNNIKSHIGYK